MKNSGITNKAWTGLAISVILLTGIIYTKYRLRQKNVEKNSLKFSQLLTTMLLLESIVSACLVINVLV
jgi:hypothetical protein